MSLGPAREWKHYERALWRGDVDAAMKAANTYDLALDMRDALELAILAGRKHHRLFDPMAVRWIMKAHERSGLRLAQVEWAAATFRRLGSGEEASGDALMRFLATGRRP